MGGVDRGLSVVLRLEGAGEGHRRAGAGRSSADHTGVGQRVDDGRLEHHEIVLDPLDPGDGGRRRLGCGPLAVIGDEPVEDGDRPVDRRGDRAGFGVDRRLDIGGGRSGSGGGR